MDDLTGGATRSIPSSVAEALAVILMEAESARRAAKTSVELVCRAYDLPEDSVVRIVAEFPSTLGGEFPPGGSGD